MGAAPAFASVGEAMEWSRAALGYLAAADATALAAETQAECLRELERAEAVLTAARASVLAAFTAGQGYAADADYSARAWLMHQTGITRGAAAGAHRVGQAGRRRTRRWWRRWPPGRCRSPTRGRSASGRTGCPENPGRRRRDLAGRGGGRGWGCGTWPTLVAEMYERSRADLPDEDPARGFEDRGVRLETTFGGAGVLYGDLTPECAAVVAAVLDALSAPAGQEDDRTHEQRYHDALQEAMRSL